jgi:hypothetical protein
MRSFSRSSSRSSPVARLALALAALLVLAGCATVPPVPAGTEGPPLQLERFFVGRTSGEGRFVSGIGGADRAFTVVTRGRFDGKTLTLREDFVFADGEKDTKTWIFEKTGEGRWIGRREDVVGTADVRPDGNTIRLSYDADVKGKDGTVTRVHFEDVLVAEGPRRVRNIAVVSKFGVPVGRVDVVFNRR